MGKVGRFKFSLTLITGFLLGTCIGGAAMNAVLSYRIDNYYNEILYLNTVVENRNARLEKLQASLNNKFVLTDIKVYISFVIAETEEESDLNPVNEVDKITIENAILEKYKKFIGREVKDIDSSILGDIIDRRIMKTDQVEYQLYVTRVVLSDTLELWVEVQHH